MYYFASDIHLGMDGTLTSGQRERLFVEWLEEVSADADAIFLLGDVFDFWFEFRRVVPKGFTRLLGKLSELSDRGVKIHFFTGNHDMWMSGYLEQECGVKLHYRPEVFELSGKRVFLAHGDNMYVRRPPFWERMMQKLFHSRVMRWVARTLIHPDALIRFGQWWSAKSRKGHVKTHVFCGEKEFLVKYARAYQACLKKVNVDYFVFGHIHCAQQYDMGDGHQAVFLGEWLYNSTYAVMDERGAMEIREYRPRV